MTKEKQLVDCERVAKELGYHKVEKPLDCTAHYKNGKWEFKEKLLSEKIGCGI